MQETLAPEFDYSQLETETRIIVQQRTSEIKTIVTRAAHDAIEIGKKLLDIKTQLGHGYFGEWLSREFGWSHRTADNYIAAADKFANFANIEMIAPSALYLLASESTPATVKESAIAQIESGEKVTHKQVKTAIEAAKLQSGDVQVVSEPEHPLYGEEVTVKRVDGDIVYCETDEGIKPIAKGWLNDNLEVQPKLEPKIYTAKQTLSEELENTVLALDIARLRSQQLQDLLTDICKSIELPQPLCDRAVSLGIF